MIKIITKEPEQEGECKITSWWKYGRSGMILLQKLIERVDYYIQDNEKIYYR